MKKIIFNMIYLIAVFAMSGCGDEFLSELPRGQVIAKTTSDFRRLLDAATDRPYRQSLVMTMSYVDIVTDDVDMDTTKWNSFTGEREHVKNLFTFEDEMWTYTTATDDKNWKNQYYTSSLVSSILAEISKANDNPALQKQLIAEARVHRAYAYLLLVNLYAKPYQAQTAAAEPGVPIVLQPTNLPSITRNSVQEVYDFILKELNEAIEDLPDDVDQYKHRPTKVAVYAILARTYLYRGDYQHAFEYADKALNIRSYLYDYNTIYAGTPDYRNLIPISRMRDDEMLLYKTTSPGQYTRNYMALDLASFNRLYPDYTVDADTVYENKDLRRALKFDAIETDGKIRKAYVNYIFDHYLYRYKTDGSSQTNNLAIATPEMYLIRAECNVRNGNLQAALDDVNAICLKRYKTGSFNILKLTDFNSDKDKILGRVLLERRRELYGKELRLFDLKRLNLPVTHHLGTLKIEVPAGDPGLIWHIYPPYIEMNSELQQNDRGQSGVKYIPAEL